MHESAMICPSGFTLSMEDCLKAHPVQQTTHHELLWRYHHHPYLHPRNLQRDRLGTKQSECTICSINFKQIGIARFASTQRLREGFAHQKQKMEMFQHREICGHHYRRSQSLNEENESRFTPEIFSCGTRFGHTVY